jgi:hypothetical protein
MMLFIDPFIKHEFPGGFFRKVVSTFPLPIIRCEGDQLKNNKIVLIPFSSIFD